MRLFLKKCDTQKFSLSQVSHPRIPFLDVIHLFFQLKNNPKNLEKSHAYLIVWGVWSARSVLRPHGLRRPRRPAHGRRLPGAASFGARSYLILSHPVGKILNRAAIPPSNKSFCRSIIKKRLNFNPVSI